MSGKYTEAQKKAILKYQESKVKIQICVTAEQREKYRAAASAQGLSLTSYIIQKLEGSE